MELASARGDPLGAKPEGAQRGNGVRERSEGGCGGVSDEVVREPWSERSEGEGATQS